MSLPDCHIVFSGGGTGGHLFPGLAAADALREAMPDARVTFAGTGRAFERQQVAAAGYDYVYIPCRPLPRGAWDAVRFAGLNFAGYVAARWFLREHRAAAVVGLGGYASVPMVRAAIAADLPTILLEQNAIPGRATRWLATSSALVCLAFAECAPHLRSDVAARITGNPVRRAFQSRFRPPDGITNVERHSFRSEGRTEFIPFAAPTFRPAGSNRQLVVLGGSGGDRTLNECVPRALAKLRFRLAGWQIVHQTGAGQVRQVQQLYDKLRIPAVAASFIDNAADVLAAADLAISRAGGTTIAELMACGTPAVLVPLTRSADDHQRANARTLAASGACLMLEADRIDGALDDRLSRVLLPLLVDESARRGLSSRIAALARPAAAAEVAAAIRDLVETEEHRAAA